MIGEVDWQANKFPPVYKSRFQKPRGWRKQRSQTRDGKFQFERARRTLSSLGPAPELVKKSN